MRIAVGGALLALAAAQAAAFEIGDVRVERRASRYFVDMQVTLDAEARRAYDALAQFENLPRINPAVLEVRRLPSAAGAPQRLFTRVRVCVAFICRTLQQVQDMTEFHAPPADGMEARVVPSLSNLTFGYAQWRFWPCGGATCMRFSAELEPAFWVPPLIGPWLIQRKMRIEAIETSQGIERLAQEPR